MTGIDIFHLLIFLATAIAIAAILGEYMARVFEGKPNILSPMLAPIEKLLYKIFGVNPEEEMDWKEYTASLVIFNLIGLAALFLLLIVQQLLPLNPQHFGPIPWVTAINAAISYVTNTNYQTFNSEAAISQFTTMLGLGLQNFLSAATGIAAAVAFIKGFTGKTIYQLGNFWVNLTRAILYILLPLAIILSIILMSQGVIQNFTPNVTAHTLQGHEQVITQGPAASLIAIKHLGTNGGGFFRANSAHPYENPTPLTDYLEILSLLAISMAFPITFGVMINNRKQGWSIFSVMMLLYITGLSVALWSEFHGSPLLAKLGIHHGINMEGKELRLGTLSSTVFAHASTGTSTGAANSAYESFMPITSLVLIFNMAIGEVIFGGAGMGLIGMFLYAIFAMFLIGLMIGRSPEIYGKKLEPQEMIMAVIALLLPAMLQLVFAAISLSTSAGISHVGDTGSNAITEIIYNYASAFGNNGSAFNGMNVDNVFYNMTLGAAMLLGRYLVIIPALAIAGSLVQKKFIPEKARFPTTSITFIMILAGTVIIVGSLTFIPVLVLGPILAHLH